jgi:hypothetical protein
MFIKMHGLQKAIAVKAALPSIYGGRVFGPITIRLRLQEVTGFRIAAVASRLVVRRRSLPIIQESHRCPPSTEVMS